MTIRRLQDARTGFSGVCPCPPTPPDLGVLPGRFEFGKDFIAKGLKPPGGDTGSGDPVSWVRHQFALQSKAGNLGLPAWREVRTQLDEARLDDLAHPSFDPALPRAGVVVLTGRLVGGAAAQAGSYREAERNHGRPDFEVWDRQTLLEWLVDAPEVGLAGTSDGPMLSLAGAIDAHTITAAALERHARSWLPPVPGTLAAATAQPGDLAAQQRRASVEAAVLVNRLRLNGRLDLAAFEALHLLRSSWCHALAADGQAPGRPQQVQASIRLFIGCATELLDQVSPVATDARALLTATARRAFAHVAYPAACMRTGEILGLLGLLARSLDPSDPLLDVLPPASQVEEVVIALASHQPGATHPVGDSFAVGLIAPALLVACRSAELAQDYLRAAAVWVADRYDDALNGIGLASCSATPLAEVTQILSGPLERGPRRRISSYLATVLIDLTAVVPDDPDLYADVLNEFLAVDIVPEVFTADELRAQWRPDGPGTRLTVHIDYSDPLPQDRKAAIHFGEPAPPVPAWDAVALTSVVRNRHAVAAIRSLLEEARS